MKAGARSDLKNFPSHSIDLRRIPDSEIGIPDPGFGIQGHSVIVPAGVSLRTRPWPHGHGYLRRDNDINGFNPAPFGFSIQFQNQSPALMLITRKTQIPVHWVFYAQIPFVMAIAANFATGAPFLYALKKFIDNPAAITFFLSIEVLVTVLGGPFASWLSDRVWTKFGRRKIFIVISNIPQALALAAMPFAPNLIWLLIFRWTYGIFGDIGTPNQALTMEVVPTKQRGLGSGFFKSQINLVNLVFWWLVFGRLDDVYFTGPLFYIAGVPGEKLV